MDMKTKRGRFVIKLIILSLCLLVAYTACALAQSSTPTPSEQSTEYTGVITVTQGTQAKIPASGLKKFIVGAPNIAAVAQDGKDLQLTAKQPGITVVNVWDSNGMSSYKVSVVADTKSSFQVAAVTSSVAPIDISLEPGESYVIKGQNITRTAVSDPTVADIVPVSTNQVLVNAKKDGLTTVRVWEGEKLYTYTFTIAKKTASAEEISNTITEQIGIPTISASLVGDTIVLRGNAPSIDLSQKAQNIAEATGRKVLNLITIESISSDTIIAALTSALPDYKLNYSVLPDHTIMVRGCVSSEEDALRIMQIMEVWMGSPETKSNDTASAQINLVGDQQKPSDVTDRAYTAAKSEKPGEVEVNEELSFPRHVFGGRIPNGPRVLATIDVDPSLAKQLLISAQVVEINRIKAKQIGIQWSEIFGSNATNPLIITENREYPIPLDEAGPFARNPLSASVRLLVSQNAAKILSEPKILIIDGHAANIIVGGEIPIPVAQSSGVGSTSISVIYKQFGIQLTVKPKVTPDGRIYLILTPEVSSLDYTNAVEASGISIPSLRTRRATTVVHVADGESLAIGGLLSYDDVKNIDKIPILGEIPIIGELFKSREFTRNETELVIIVTPKIIPQGTQVPIAKIEP